MNSGIQPNQENRAHGSISYEGLSWVQVFLVLLYFVSASFYLLWRPTTFNPDALVFSWIVYAAELFGLMTAALHVFMVWRLTIREPPEARTGQTVDVFIPTYNEPVEMVRRTLSAAIRISYPHETWLLDDGNRAEMRALALELGAHYLARSENMGAKAGNLNNALRQSKGEFVAVFDADHAPTPEFLHRTIGYFKDARVAFVSTPQDFYNLDSYQHPNHSASRLVWNEQSLFFRVIQRGKDYWNAAFFCGTCGVMRRQALDEIGMFSMGTITEDLDTSIELHRRGWKSIYHAESLAFGVAPNDIVPFLKQRMRWGQGAMQVLRRHAFMLFASGLSLPQRISYLASIAMYFDGWQKAILYFSPALVLLTGTMPVAELSWEFLARFIPYYLLTFWIFEEIGRGYGRSLAVERYNMSRFAVFAWATLALFRRKLKFRVTKKGRDAAHARDRKRMLLPQQVVLLLNLAAIAGGLVLFLSRNWLPSGAFWANIFWAVVNLSLAASVIGWARRIAKHQRREYRFPIPLPASLSFQDEIPHDGVLDDISHLGFKYYGPFPASVRVGTRLKGELQLPWIRLEFEAVVHRLVGSKSGQAGALGCGFHWKDEQRKDQLAMLLFGSNLQWSLNGLGEQIRTPLQRITDWFNPEAARSKRGMHWAMAKFRSLNDTDDTVRTGVILKSQESGKPHTLAAFHKYKERTELIIGISGRSGLTSLRGKIISENVMRTGGHDIYVYAVIPSEALSLSSPKESPYSPIRDAAKEFIPQR